MRASKLAVRDALVGDPEVRKLVHPSQIHAADLAVLPVLPAVELVTISSERIGQAVCPASVVL